MAQILPAGDETLRARLFACGRLRVFARHEVVYHQGDPGDTLHLIHRGHISLSVNTPSGDRATLSILGEGDAFGESVVLSGDDRRDATAVSIEPSKTVAIHRREVDALRRSDPAFADYLLMVLVDRAAQRTAHLVDALFAPAEPRIVRRLIAIAEAYDTGGVETIVLSSQRELAAMAGSSRATVNRVLGDLHALGIIRVARNHIAILDRARLTRCGQ